MVHHLRLRGWGLKHMYVSSVLVYAVLWCCSAQTGAWRSEVLHYNSNAIEDRYTAGRSVLVLPLIADGKFDTSTTFSSREQAKVIQSIRRSAVPVLQNEFETHCLQTNANLPLDSFYTDIFTQDILSLAAREAVWHCIPGRYMLVTRIQKGVRIQSFEGTVKRKAVVHGELWDVKQYEIIWSANATGVEIGKKITDKKFIMNGLKTLYQALPDIIPVVNEDEW